MEKYNFNVSEMKESSVDLDATDRRLLDLIQRDDSRTNQDLAAALHISPATCLRRVRRLQEAGVIERRVAVLAPGRIGAGFNAIVEVTLDRQGAEHLAAFERRAVAESAVQQCWRVAPGPDFMLVLRVGDMPAYQVLAERLFTQDANVRNVRTFFATRRAKFSTEVPLGAAPRDT